VKRKPHAAAPHLVGLLKEVARTTNDPLVKRWVRKLIERGEGAASTPRRKGAARC
jgi:hypothetical protein